MKLIIGLGNPGEKYRQTRHNLGFLAIDALASKFGVSSSWFIDKKFKSQILKINELSTKNYELMLVKPQTFVNHSGQTVKKIVNFYKIEPVDILVIRDDIDLARYKIRGPKTETGSGGHLGIESIRQNLGTESFYQLKIGVGRPPHNLDPSDFVLQRTTDEEWKNFRDIAKKAVVTKVQNWINE